MSRPVTPASQAYGNMSAHAEGSVSGRPAFTGSKANSYLSAGAPGASGFDHSQGAPSNPSILAQTTDMHDDALRADHDGELSTAPGPELHRTNSRTSQSQAFAPSKSGTLKKKASLKRTGSLGRTASRRSSYAGSVKSLQLGDKEKHGQGEDNNSAFYCPVPTSGSPTELLATRFQAWRKVLKDLINYFRDLQKGYETRSRAAASVSSVINTVTVPSNFMASRGVGDAAYILRDFHKQATLDAQKAANVENEIIMQLTGLRSDLQQKIKEIKSLSGDFKNSVDKEQESTKRAVRQLQEALGLVDHDAAAISGKGDPFIIKQGVDRQVERQMEEENYLHRAYLNLESSGRELESIVVGEIQKAYNAFAGILRREADEAYETSEKLKEGPLAMAKDHEWDDFTVSNSQMVDPRIPVRTAANITYPGKDHPAAIEVRSGMLERKSKYLKNYTPGWYILSPTHLHEFKSADRIASQSPVMSLYLPEQKLGSHSEPGSSSHKFMLKGRQTGSMHRGHAWVFRAESHDTMMAWFGDIKELTEKSGEERNAFVRRTHARSLSGNSLKAASIGGSSDGGLEDTEADHVPYSSEQSVRGPSVSAEAGATAAGAAGLGAGTLGVSALHRELEDNRSEAGWRPPPRPSPGGRFPSEVNVVRGLQAPQSPSSGEDSEEKDREVMMAAGGLPGSGIPFTNAAQHQGMQLPPQHLSENDSAGAAGSAVHPNSTVISPMTPSSKGSVTQGHQYGDFRHGGRPPSAPGHPYSDAGSQYGDWMAPMAVGAAGAGAVGAGAVGASYYYDNRAAKQHEQTAPQQPLPVANERSGEPIEVIENSERQMDGAVAVPLHGTSSAPIPVETAEVGAAERSPSRPRGITQSTQATGMTGATTLTDVSQPDSSAVGAISSHTLSTVPTSIDGGNGVEEELYDNGFASDAVGAVAGGMAERPKPVSSRSVLTISDLHMPGEYPKVTDTTATPARPGGY